MWKTLLFVALSTVQASTLRQLPSVPLTFPYVEPGFDYVDHDIKNVPGKTIDDCQTPCATMSNCKAYTWSDFGGGTCWLKDGRDVISVSANVKSSFKWLKDMKNTVCQLKKDTDYADNDLAHFSGKKKEDCCDLCHNFLGCRAYAWNNDFGGTCWLKSKGGTPIIKSGVWAAEAYPVEDVITPPVEFNTDYKDHDIGNKPSPSYFGCYGICNETPGCHVFVWTNFAGGTCWLKASKGDKLTKNGAIAVEVTPAVDDCKWLADGFDYNDHDLSNKQGISNAGDCCQICKGTKDCKAFAYSLYMGGTCWLKWDKGTVVSAPGAKAGSLA